LLDYDYACASENFEPGNLKSLQKAIVEITKQINRITKPKRWVLEFDEAIINHTDFLGIMEEGKANDLPYWRTLKSNGELNPKYPGGIEGHQALLKQEDMPFSVRVKGHL